MKKELKDYSGPYNHHLKWEDFSKEFLVKLMKSWQGAYLGIQGAWVQVVSEKYRLRCCRRLRSASSAYSGRQNDSRVG